MTTKQTDKLACKRTPEKEKRESRVRRTGAAAAGKVKWEQCGNVVMAVVFSVGGAGLPVCLFSPVLSYAFITIFLSPSNSMRTRLPREQYLFINAISSFRLPEEPAAATKCRKRDESSPGFFFKILARSLPFFTPQMASFFSTALIAARVRVAVADSFANSLCLIREPSPKWHYPRTVTLLAFAEVSCARPRKKIELRDSFTSLGPYWSVVEMCARVRMLSQRPLFFLAPLCLRCPCSPVERATGAGDKMREQGREPNDVH